jgi:hypothetical protein
MRPDTSKTAQPFFRGLRRWLRGACLRIPWLGRLLRPPKPQPAPKSVRQIASLHVEGYEERNFVDFLLALPTSAVVGGIVLDYVAATLRTPEQVMAHGWGDGIDEGTVAPAGPPAPALRADLSDAVFLDLTVTPLLEENTPSPAQAETISMPQRPADTEESKSQTETLNNVSADPVQAPLFDQDFLDEVKRQMAGPLPVAGDPPVPGGAASDDGAVRDGSGLGDGGSAGGSAGGGLNDSSSPGGAGAAGASNNDGVNPFLTANNTAPRNAGPLAAATPGAQALPAVLPLGPAPVVPFNITALR